MSRGRPITLTDDELLAAAQAVIIEKGLDATTADVARRANISESVIFHRFKSKEALFLSILERQMKLNPELESLNALVGKGDIAEHLFTVGTVLIEKMHTILPFFMLSFSSPVKMNVLREWVRKSHPVHLQTLIEYFEAEIRAGRLRKVNVETLANTFLGGIRQYVFIELFAGKGKDVYVSRGKPFAPEADKYLRAMIDILLHGATDQKASTSNMGHKKRR